MTERINTEMWSVGLGDNDDTDGSWVRWQTCPDRGKHRLDTMNIYTWSVAQGNAHWITVTLKPVPLQLVRFDGLTGPVQCLNHVPSVADEETEEEECNKHWEKN